jgi:hypothetical protein
MDASDIGNLWRGRAAHGRGGEDGKVAVDEETGRRQEREKEGEKEEEEEEAADRGEETTEKTRRSKHHGADIIESINARN